MDPIAINTTPGSRHPPYSYFNGIALPTTSSLTSNITTILMMDLPMLPIPSFDEKITLSIETPVLPHIESTNETSTPCSESSSLDEKTMISTETPAPSHIESTNETSITCSTSPSSVPCPSSSPESRRKGRQSIHRRHTRSRHRSYNPIMKDMNDIVVAVLKTPTDPSISIKKPQSTTLKTIVPSRKRMKNIVATMLARPVDSTPLSMSEPKKSTDVTAGSAPKHHDCKSRKIPSTCIIGADTQEQLFALSSRVSSDNHRYRSNTQFLHPPFPFENKTTSLPPSPSHPVRPPRPMSLDLGVLYPAMPTVVCQHKIRKSKNIQKSYRNVINIIKRGAKVEVAVFSKDSEERKGGPMAKKHKSQKTFGFGSVSQSMMRAKSKAEQAFLNRFRFPTSSASSQASSSSSSINMDTSEIHRVEMISGSSDALPQKRTHIPSFIAYRNPDEDFKQIKRNTPCFCHLLYPHPIKNVDIFNERREILALPGTNAAREPLRIRLFI